MNITETERNYRLHLAQTAVLETMKREGKTATGGYAIAVCPDEENYHTFCVPLRKKSEAKKLKKKWLKSGAGMSYFHLSIG
jgi:hypothetical protein